MGFFWLNNVLLIACLLLSTVFCDNQTLDNESKNESEEMRYSSKEETFSLNSSFVSSDPNRTSTSNQTIPSSLGSVASSAVPNSGANDGSEVHCARHCRTHPNKRYQEQCVLKNFKQVDQLKSKIECLEKCKSDESCESAIYTKPRLLTTDDLNNLYHKVIDSETWISIKKPGALVNYASGLGIDFSEMRDYQNQRPNEFDLNDEFQKASLVNMSNFKVESLGSCYLYNATLPVEQKLHCNSSRLAFQYEQIECIEDPNCVKPRKQCPCGRCGPDCKQFNYVHIPNACMGKYFFGHLSTNNLETCLQFCLENAECKSVDLGSAESCLINYVDRNETQLIMECDRKNDENWDYYELQCDSECPDEKPRPDKSEDTCNNNPGICQNGGNCETIQLPPPIQSFTYNCHCPCNWCGKHCEKLNMRTFKNGCLNSSVLAWSVAENSGDCIDICLNEIHCKSISYSATAGTCVLHWADHTSETIVSSSRCPNYRTDAPEKEWSFYEIICNSTVCHSEVEVINSDEVKGCESNPCFNGGECADIFRFGKIVGFHCLCKCGYCGDRCETQNYALNENACIWGSHISDSPADYYRKAVSLKTCLNVCASKYPLCRSIDYSNKGECLLNKKDSDLTPITPKCNNYLTQKWNLYDISCVCNNKAIVY